MVTGGAARATGDADEQLLVVAACDSTRVPAIPTQLHNAWLTAPASVQRQQRFELGPPTPTPAPRDMTFLSVNVLPAGRVSRAHQFPFHLQLQPPTPAAMSLSLPKLSPAITHGATLAVSPTAGNP